MAIRDFHEVGVKGPDITVRDRGLCGRGRLGRWGGKRQEVSGDGDGKASAHCTPGGT